MKYKQDLVENITIKGELVTKEQIQQINEFINQK